MQDTPAPKRDYSGRVYPDRDCRDCGAVFTPSNAVQQRCLDCRPERSATCFCAFDGCGEPIRKDNKSGYCKVHKTATARVPVRTCAADKCDRSLRADNKSGFCTDHAEQGENVRAYRERYYAELREESVERYLQRPECSVDGCANRLRSDNSTGRCAEHIYIPMEWGTCSVDGCGARVKPDNRLGRCMDHRALHWGDKAPVCDEPACGRTLHRDNQTGFCHEHRGAWRREYNRKYYQRNQADLVEYARQYRAAHPEEHRAASLRWERANPERKRANDAAFRLRNRPRLRIYQREASRKHYAAHKGRRLAQCRDYRLRNPEKVKATLRRWRTAHPEYYSVNNARRRLRMQLPREDRAISWAYRQAIRNDFCIYCGAAGEHTDHFFPLAKGGTDIWFNLVRACRRCNLTKRTMCGTAFLLLSGG